LFSGAVEIRLAEKYRLSWVVLFTEETQNNPDLLSWSASTIYLKLPPWHSLGIPFSQLIGFLLCDFFSMSLGVAT
jgi:hypothetical protein